MTIAARSSGYRSVVALFLCACFASAAAQELAPRAGDADIGTSYALRKSLVWFDRTLTQREVYGAAYADIDRDGRMDVVIAPVYYTGLGPAEPIRVYMNTGSGFADQTGTRLTVPGPGLVHARETIAGDFNGDGWVDIFIVGHGSDAPPYPGEAPQLFINNGNGTLHYDDQFASMVGFDHGAASGDIDRDGDLDVLVVQQHHAHFLINDGSAHFTRDDTRLPAESEWKNWFTGEIMDLDRDGFLDVILGGHEYDGAPTTIYWGDSGGSFSASRKTILPTVATREIVLAYGGEDIDGDGDRDLVLSRTGSNPFYSGRYLQVLVQTQPRVFADESASRISLDTSKPWIDYLRLQDINGDQFLDILHDDRGETVNGPVAWVNDGHGVFTTYGGTVTPAPTLEIGDAAIAEGNSGSKMLVFPVRASQPLVSPVVFDTFTESGSALAGSDFDNVYAPGQVIAATQRLGSFQVPILGEPWIEMNEKFAAVVGYASGAVLSRSRAHGTILNDDMATLSVADAVVQEGPAGQKTLAFSVNLSWPLPTPVSFDISTSNGTALAGSDYVARAQSGRVIDPGRTSAKFEVAILGDALNEPSETFNVTVSAVSGALSGDLSAVGTIVDDDPAPTVAPTTAQVSAKPVTCQSLRGQIVALEQRVAVGALDEARGIGQIMEREKTLRTRGCR